MTRLYVKGPAIERALARVVIEPSTCWTWNGSHNRAGYAKMKVADGVYRHVHAVIYEHFVGPVGEGLELDHLCRNRGCVNYEHLEAVTHRENARRGAGAFVLQTGRCARGHLRSEHGYTRTDGSPGYCRRCKQEKRAAGEWA